MLKVRLRIYPKQTIGYLILKRDPILNSEPINNQLIARSKPEKQLKPLRVDRRPIAPNTYIWASTSTSTSTLNSTQTTETNSNTLHVTTAQPIWLSKLESGSQSLHSKR